MAKKFTDSKGKAQKESVDYYKFKEGENRFRMVGELLPRYVYWKDNTAGKSLSVECLGFDRDQEKFTNVEMDWFRHYFPEDKCQWAYLINVIDPSDGKVRVMALKKKLLSSIITAAEDLGDPTDPEKGWDVVVKREKTGPSAFNVEYTLMVLKCKTRPLTAEEKEAVAEAKSIDEQFPRPTPEAQKEFIERNYINPPSEEQEETGGEEIDELDSSKDVPF